MKRAIVIFLLMLAASANSTDLFATYASVREYVKSELGYSSSSTGPMSDSLMNVYIRICAVATNAPLQMREVEKSIITGDKLNKYVLDSLASIISVEWSKNDSVKSLVFVPRELWFEQEHKSCRGTEATGWNRYPSYFDYSDSLLFIHPPPDGGSDTIKILGVERYPDIDTATTLTMFPRKYRIVLAMRAARDIGLAIQSPLAGPLDTKLKEYKAEIGAATHQRGAIRVPAGN